MKIKNETYNFKIKIPYLQFNGDKIVSKLVQFNVQTNEQSLIQGLTLERWFNSILKNKLVLETAFDDFQYEKLFIDCLYVERLDLDYITDLFFKILTQHLTIQSISYNELY